MIRLDCIGPSNLFLVFNLKNNKTSSEQITHPYLWLTRRKTNNKEYALTCGIVQCKELPLLGVTFQGDSPQLLCVISRSVSTPASGLDSSQFSLSLCLSLRVVKGVWGVLITFHGKLNDHFTFHGQYIRHFTFHEKKKRFYTISFSYFG